MECTLDAEPSTGGFVSKGTEFSHDSHPTAVRPFKKYQRNTEFSCNNLQMYLNNETVYSLYRAQQQMGQSTVPPGLVATLIFPEADGSRNLLDPREKPAQDKCCLPWLVSHENQGSQTPSGIKDKRQKIKKGKNPNPQTRVLLIRALLPHNQ